MSTEHPLVARRQALYEWARGDALMLSARCTKAEERIERLEAALHKAGDRLMQVQPAIDIDCGWALGIVPQAQDEIADALKVEPSATDRDDPDVFLTQEEMDS